MQNEKERTPTFIQHAKQEAELFLAGLIPLAFVCEATNSLVWGIGSAFLSLWLSYAIQHRKINSVLAGIVIGLALAIIFAKARYFTYVYPSLDAWEWAP